MVSDVHLPDATVYRLHQYIRAVEHEGIATDGWITSSMIAASLKLDSSVVRRDLYYCNIRGLRGKGYSVALLSRRIKQRMGMDTDWSVALFGAGNLGKALAAYQGFKKLGFHIDFLFDNEKDKIGTRWRGRTIFPHTDAQKIIAEKRIQIAVICVPAQEAVALADELMRWGIRAILNFAPVNIQKHRSCRIINADLAIELTLLSSFLVPDASIRHAGL